MNTVIEIFKLQIELAKQMDLGQILPSTAASKMGLKAEQGLQDAIRTAALLCAACKEIGQPESDVIEIDFGPTIEDEQS